MKMKFMLIDDSKIDLFVNEKIIEKAGILSEVKKFTSAISAIKYFKLLESHERVQTMFFPDIIFLDINMPELNGFQFISEFEKLLSIKKRERIKIFILSSSTNTEDVQQAKKQQSCEGFINKPLTSQVMEEIVSHFRPYLTKYDYLDNDNEY